MKLTDDKFIKKSEVQKAPASRRAAIRAAMHESAACEEVFDLLAQATQQAIRCNCENKACGHIPGKCMGQAGQAKAIHVGSLCQQCADLMPKQYMLPPLGTAREAQAQKTLKDYRGQDYKGGTIVDTLVETNDPYNPEIAVDKCPPEWDNLPVISDVNSGDEIAGYKHIKLDWNPAKPGPQTPDEAWQHYLDTDEEQEGMWGEDGNLNQGWKPKQSQAGGPNMLMDAPDNSGVDAPEADPQQVTDISDVWPEADIMKQTQDLRNQGMPDQQIFKQLVDMGVLGTPKPMQQDLAYLDQIMKGAQLGTGPAGTAASPMDGQRDSLSHEEIPGTGKIQVESADPRMVRKVVTDESFKQQKDMQQPKLPSMRQHQDRANEYADFMPAPNMGHQPGRGAQALPPAQPPAAPPAAPAAPPTPETGAPPGEDMEMGEEDDMPIDDMRSLSEVMEDLMTDVEVIQQKMEDGETMLDGQDMEPVHDDTGSMPSGPPKIAVDQPAKDYYEGYFGEYGKQLSEDRHASIVDIVDEVAAQYKVKLTTYGIDKLATFVEARPRFDAEEGNEKFAALNDSLLVNYLFKTGGSSPDISLASSAFKMALHESAQGAKVLKFAEGKMKQPKVKGQSDDAVKQDKLKDNAKDKGLELRRPAHLPMHVIETSKSGVYTKMLIEWDPDADAAKRSDAGMAQAVISYVKGLESVKEFKDLGFLGQISIDELDIEAGQAEVHFRTMKPADAPTVVKEE